MSAPPIAAFAAPCEDAPGGAPATRDALLLVEDDDMVAMLVAHVLERLHWRVLRAGDGAEAECLLAQHQATIGLALVDCGLPDAKGEELCLRLRAVLPGLPLLLTSGRDQSGPVRALAGDGPAAFLAKPFLPGDVTRQVQNLIARAA